ncbi:unnamed protein product [Arctogadus glacialis]
MDVACLTCSPGLEPPVCRGHKEVKPGLEAHLGGLPQHTGSASKRELQDSLTEPNMLVVRAALAEEQVMRRSQEEIREVEERVEALLLPLESCFNLQQGEMGHVKDARQVLALQRAKLCRVGEELGSRYPQVPADIGRRLGEAQHAVRTAEEKGPSLTQAMDVACLTCSPGLEPPVCRGHKEVKPGAPLKPAECRTGANPTRWTLVLSDTGLEAHLGGLPQHTGSASKRELQDRAFTHIPLIKSCPDSLSRASDTSDSRLVRYNRKPCCDPQPDNMGKPRAQT